MAYITRTTEALKADVNQLAISMMLLIDMDNIDEATAKRNILAACYNDGIRCFADALADLIEELAKQE